MEFNKRDTTTNQTIGMLLNVKPLKETIIHASDCSTCIQIGKL
jgi:hypothetical protein